MSRREGQTSTKAAAAAPPPTVSHLVFDGRGWDEAVRAGATGDALAVEGRGRVSTGRVQTKKHQVILPATPRAAADEDSLIGELEILKADLGVRGIPYRG